MKIWQKVILGGFIGVMVPGMAAADTEIDINKQIAMLKSSMAEAQDKEFKKMDTNNDGQISREEYIAYVVEETKKKADSSFNQLDQDGDGNISKVEYTEFMEFATGKMNEMIKKMQQK